MVVNFLAFASSDFEQSHILTLLTLPKLIKSATAFIPANLFHTFDYHPPRIAPIFEINLDALLQCLNIFGNAGGGAGPILGGKGKKRWAGEGDGPNEGDDEGASANARGARGKEKRTGLRMVWMDHGEPLSMFL